MDCSPPNFSVHGTLQARILEWVAMPSSGDLRDSGIKPGSPALQVESLPSEPLGKPNIIWQLKLNFFKKRKDKPVSWGQTAGLEPRLSPSLAV